MKIVFDCRYIRVGSHDGISRYTAGLVAALSEIHQLTMLISDERQLDKLPDAAWVLGPSTTGFGEIFTARTVNRLKPDVVFSPMQTMGSWGRRYRLIVTLHDLIYYTNRTPPRDLSWFVRVLWRLYHLAWWPQRILLNRADAVVTVSETTRTLMLEHRLTRRSITVVPNAADAASVAPRSHPDTRDLVYMGSFMPYKNVDVLVRALSELPGYRLHLMSRVTAEERQRLSALAAPEQLVFHDGATDEEYLELLSSATALVSASRAEGFGIPLVEAMGVGTPVVVSDIPIFREVAGAAAVYFSVGDPSALASAVKRLEPPGEWERRSRSSVQQVKAYSWADSARTLLELIDTLGKPIGR